MFVRRYLFLASLILILGTTSALAQALPVAAENTPTTKAQTATAAVADKGVRFTAPAETAQLRLEIYSATGERVFDSGPRPGSVLDWQPTDVAQGLADGSYLCVLSIKDLQGQTRQRHIALALQAGQATLARVRMQELTDPQKQLLAASTQAQKNGSADADDELTILRAGKTRALTVAAHNGQDGQVTSTTGALTFRTGDFFTGRDREQVRITPEGQVGIGTDKPEATLDVAGTVRAREGIVLADGTLLKSAADLKSQLNLTTVAAGATNTATNGQVTPAAAGTGTQNRLAKWTDNAGTLGDSTVFEAGTNVGIGTQTPGTINGVSFSTIPFHLFRANNSSYMAVDSSGAGNYSGLVLNRSSAAPNQRMWVIDSQPSADQTSSLLSFSTYNDQGFPTSRMTLDRSGNIGIGTTNPQAKLEVAGNIKLSGAGNGIMFPDGSTLTSAAGAGGTPSGNSVVAAINDLATNSFINDNRLSGNVARLNGANNWTGANIFGTGLSANGALITNVGNPVAATDAANKGYVDATTVRFVPGAEQLSVGDANGTGAMINLRGGSTCCTGPGGHTPAFFKVFQNGSMVVTGNLGIGVSPMQGKGYRTSWDSYKGAFRSGYADNEWDDPNVGFFSWAGGSNSTSSGLYALAFGDTNSAESTSSIVFGSGNQVKGAAGFSAGAGNRVCDTYGVAFGNKAQSGGPLINGRCDPDSFNLRGLAAIAMGFNVTADQDHTIAFGKFASNNGFSGTFVWSDGSATASADTFRNTANNEFAARATGGFRFRTNLTGTTGCNLPAGSGVFNCTSSRTTKENFKLIDGNDVLARLRKIPVSSWNYISEGQQVRHMGPMAEDFYQAFGLGTGNTSIGVQDLAGVSLAAVKALDQRIAQLQQRTAEVEQLRNEVNALRAANATMEQRLAALEQSMQERTQAQPTTPTPRR
ncbi:MAG: tail fiber domain-containing protein [Pyrinomonadaceae bacterium]